MEHIVHARGKRSSFTSVSLDRSKITDFGPQLYRLDAPQLIGDKHQLIEHRGLLESLREIISALSKAEKAQALQAQRYAVRRKEGFNIFPGAEPWNSCLVAEIAFITALKAFLLAKAQGFASNIILCFLLPIQQRANTFFVRICQALLWMRESVNMLPSLPNFPILLIC
ncbi:MAG: hypothetical protein ACOYOE_09200 [Chlorobium sp.]